MNKCTGTAFGCIDIYRLYIYQMATVDGVLDGFICTDSFGSASFRKLYETGNIRNFIERDYLLTANNSQTYDTIFGTNSARPVATRGAESIRSIVGGRTIVSDVYNSITVDSAAKIYNEFQNTCSNVYRMADFIQNNISFNTINDTASFGSALSGLYNQYFSAGELLSVYELTSTKTNTPIQDLRVLYTSALMDTNNPDEMQNQTISGLMTKSQPIKILAKDAAIIMLNASGTINQLIQSDITKLSSDILTSGFLLARDTAGTTSGFSAYSTLIMRKPMFNANIELYAERVAIETDLDNINNVYGFWSYVTAVITHYDATDKTVELTSTFSSLPISSYTAPFIEYIRASFDANITVDTWISSVYVQSTLNSLTNKMAPLKARLQEIGDLLSEVVYDVYKWIAISSSTIDFYDYAEYYKFAESTSSSTFKLFIANTVMSLNEQADNYKTLNSSIFDVTFSSTNTAWMCGTQSEFDSLRCIQSDEYNYWIGAYIKDCTIRSPDPFLASVNIPRRIFSILTFLNQSFNQLYPGQKMLYTYIEELHKYIFVIKIIDIDGVLCFQTKETRFDQLFPAKIINADTEIAGGLIVSNYSGITMVNMDPTVLKMTVQGKLGINQQFEDVNGYLEIDNLSNYNLLTFIAEHKEVLFDNYKITHHNTSDGSLDNYRVNSSASTRNRFNLLLQLYESNKIANVVPQSRETRMQFLQARVEITYRTMVIQNQAALLSETQARISANQLILNKTIELVKKYEYITIGLLIFSDLIALEGPLFEILRGIFKELLLDMLIEKLFQSELGFASANSGDDDYDPVADLESRQLELDALYNTQKAEYDLLRAEYLAQENMLYAQPKLDSLEQMDSRIAEIVKLRLFLKRVSDTITVQTIHLGIVGVKTRIYFGQVTQSETVETYISTYVVDRIPQTPFVQSDKEFFDLIKTRALVNDQYDNITIKEYVDAHQQTLAAESDDISNKKAKAKTELLQRSLPADNTEPLSQADKDLINEQLDAYAIDVNSYTYQTLLWSLLYNTANSILSRNMGDHHSLLEQTIDIYNSQTGNLKTDFGYYAYITQTTRNVLITGGQVPLAGAIPANIWARTNINTYASNLADYTSRISTTLAKISSLNKKLDTFDDLQILTGTLGYDAESHNRLRDFIRDLYQLYMKYPSASGISHMNVLQLRDNESSQVHSIEVKILDADNSITPQLLITTSYLDYTKYESDLSYKETFGDIINALYSANSLVNYACVLFKADRTTPVYEQMIADNLFPHKFGSPNAYIVVDNITDRKVVFDEKYTARNGQDANTIYMQGTDTRLSEVYSVIDARYKETYGSIKYDYNFVVDYKWNDAWNIMVMRYITIANIDYRISCILQASDLISSSMIIHGETILKGDLTVKTEDDRTIFQIDSINKNISNMYKVGIGIQNPSCLLDINDTTYMDVIALANIESAHLRALNQIVSAIKGTASESRLAAETIVKSINYAVKEGHDDLGLNDDSYFYCYQVNTTSMRVEDITVVYHGYYPVWNGLTYSQIQSQSITMRGLVSNTISPTLQNVLDTTLLYDGSIFVTEHNFVSGKKRSLHRAFIYRNALYIIGIGINIQQYNILTNISDKINSFFSVSNAHIAIMNYSNYLNHNPSTVTPNYNLQKVESTLRVIKEQYPTLTSQVDIFYYADATTADANTILTHSYNGRTSAEYIGSEYNINYNISQTGTILKNVADKTTLQRYSTFLTSLRDIYTYALHDGAYGAIPFNDGFNYYCSMFIVKVRDSDIYNAAGMLTYRKGVYIYSYFLKYNDYIGQTLKIHGDSEFGGGVTLMNTNTSLPYIVADPYNKYLGINTNERFAKYGNIYNTLVSTSTYNSPYQMLVQNTRYPNAVFDRIAEDATSVAANDYRYFGSYSGATIKRSSNLYSINEMWANTRKNNQNSLIDGLNWENYKHYGSDISFEIKDNTGTTTEIGQLKLVIDQIDEHNNIHAGFGVQVIDNRLPGNSVEEKTKNLMYVNNNKQLFVEGVMLGGKLFHVDDDGILKYDGLVVMLGQRPEPPTAVFPSVSATRDGRVDVTTSSISEADTWFYSVNRGRDWSLGIGTFFILPDGIYEVGDIQVKNRDGAGNTSSVISNTMRVRIDTRQPDPPIVTYPYGITPNFTVSITLPADGIEYQYSINGGTIWETGTGTSFTIEDGTYNAGVICVRFTNSLGNTSINATNTYQFTVDTIRPDPPSVTYPTEQTNINIVNVAISAGANAYSYSLDAGITWISANADIFILPDGVYDIGSVKVRCIDAAGNISTMVSNILHINLGTTPPNQPIVYFPHGTTNQNLIEISPSQDGAVQYKYSVDGGITWNIGPIHGFYIQDGDHETNTVQVRSFDAYGNQSIIVSNAQRFIIDTIPPAIDIIFPSARLIVEEDGDTDPNKYLVRADLKSEAESFKYSLDAGVTWATAFDGFYIWSKSVIRAIDVRYTTTTIYNKNQIVIEITDKSGNIARTYNPNPIYIIFPFTVQKTLYYGYAYIIRIQVDSAISGYTWEYSIDNGVTWRSDKSSYNTFVLPMGDYYPIVYNNIYPIQARTKINGLVFRTYKCLTTIRTGDFYV